MQKRDTDVAFSVNMADNPIALVSISKNGIRHGIEASHWLEVEDVWLARYGDEGQKELGPCEKWRLIEEILDTWSCTLSLVP